MHTNNCGGLFLLHVQRSEISDDARDSSQHNGDKHAENADFSQPDYVAYGM